MEQEKQVFNLPEGVKEVVIRQGDAPKVLDPKAPLPYDAKGQLPTVAEYLQKRIGAQQFEQRNCTIYVNREKVEIVLVFNERDGYNRGTVMGSLALHPDFASLCINRDETWQPAELGLLLKMHRYWFEDRKLGMDLVTTLLNYKADISQKVEKSIEANGNRADVFSQVVNSNLPKTITLKLPIFKGTPAIPVEIEFFAKVNGNDVSFHLISPGANDALQEYRDRAIDVELAKIREIAPEIAIIEQ